MRDRRRVPSGPWQALGALSAALLVGCQSGLLSFASFNSSESGSERAVAQELPLGSWTRDRLHCAKDRCERWYEIAVEERGTLQVDLYAPVGRDLPNCEMQLETGDGDLVAAPASRVQTQQRLRHETGPASYRLRIVSKGSRDLFDFEVVAQLRKQGKAPAKSPPRGARTKPAPAPGASTPPDIPPATTRPAPEQGELFEGETVIGRIEILDVYRTGSRARIVGTLSAPSASNPSPASRSPRMGSDWPAARSGSRASPQTTGPKWVAAGTHLGMPLRTPQHTESKAESRVSRLGWYAPDPGETAGRHEGDPA